MGLLNGPLLANEYFIEWKSKVVLRPHRTCKHKYPYWVNTWINETLTTAFLWWRPKMSIQSAQINAQHRKWQRHEQNVPNQFRHYFSLHTTCVNGTIVDFFFLFPTEPADNKNENFANIISLHDLNVSLWFWCQNKKHLISLTDVVIDSKIGSVCLRCRRCFARNYH